MDHGRQTAQTTPTTAAPQGQPTAFPYAAGDLIADKYQLVEVIGEGGMGAVWRARNLALEVDVALKLIHEGVASPEARSRLLREARSAARIQHPSTVRIHDFGQTERGDPFIVMELLEGESLADVLDRKGKLPPARAVQLMLPICGALTDAHQRSIVHRDIKPDNIILVSERGRTSVPKLVDFGIAKVNESRERIITGNIPADPDTATRNRLARRLTQLGSLLGSPDYMSPEQARGDTSVDERADLWALSVVLYEMIAGMRPFDAERVEDLLVAILIEDPPPLSDIDPALWAILERGLSRDRRERWQSANEMGRALAGWLLAEGVQVDITGNSVQQRWFEEDAAGLSVPPAAQDPEASSRFSVVDSAQTLDVAAPRSRRVLAAVVAGSVAAVAAVAVALVALTGGEAEPDAASPSASAAAASDVAETAAARNEDVPAAPTGEATSAAKPSSSAQTAGATTSSTSAETLPKRVITSPPERPSKPSSPPRPHASPPQPPPHARPPVERPQKDLGF